MLKNLFELRGNLDKKTGMIISALGFLLLLLIWSTVCWLKIIPEQIFPPPWKVFTAFGELHTKNSLVRNLGFSLFLNVSGYLEAVVISLFVGVLMGIYPLFRELISKYLNAARYLPLPAVTGLFIAWFGIGTNMKIQFLACGIIVYLIPVVVQRIVDIDAVYEHTAITLGAKPWQRIFHVYLPADIYHSCRNDQFRLRRNSH